MSQHSTTWKKVKFLVKFFRIRGISIVSFTVKVTFSVYIFKVAFSVYIFNTNHIQYITIEETVNKKAYEPIHP